MPATVSLIDTTSVHSVTRPVKPATVILITTSPVEYHQNSVSLRQCPYFPPHQYNLTDQCSQPQCSCSLTIPSTVFLITATPVCSVSRLVQPDTVSLIATTSVSCLKTNAASHSVPKHCHTGGCDNTGDAALFGKD